MRTEIDMRREIDENRDRDGKRDGVIEKEKHANL